MSKTTENSAGLSTEARARNLYDLGSTTIFAHAGDPRFAYALYVPKTITQPGHRVELVARAVSSPTTATPSPSSVVGKTA